MEHLVDRLSNVDAEKIGSNKLTAYLPYRKGAKEFDFESVACVVLSWLMGKQVKRNLSMDAFEAKCSEYLEDRLSDTSIIEDLRKMYFSGDALSRTAPEFMLLRTHAKTNASTKHLVELLKSFFDKSLPSVEFESGTNFLEKGFLDLLKNELREADIAAAEECYLPFVAEKFVRDVTFLAGHSEYLLEQLPSCIELYNFIYCTQLGLNIRNWTSGSPPSSKPLYFILDTEKASSERVHVTKEGYRSLAGPMADVFPILSMLEYFNSDTDYPKAPLWSYAKAVHDSDDSNRARVHKSLVEFSEQFRLDRKLPAVPAAPIDAIEAMKHLMSLGVKQFAKTVNEGRHRVQQQYMEVFDKEVARNFLQSRGRAGRVLVINQDFVLLLTNLAIGDRPSVRFQELLRAFKERGFYFDKGSQQALISFYERVGNVDRMSDSGDAVYVRNTI
ncbi:DNA phosphorothioation-dependent restriction protein DptG [Rhodopirellula halodulae]|uniref:DNA phosphorothioation-dependent restriction protein DptG n=1 Tax=Rhodopirellula halodulae TaxID=2894198 RepID=UPI001E553EBC|nr:DNA phosphorothioation-dependent restriction protein DptG [Rhodopirellula sp. JC737]MCC9654587.1 DNA phosphorothioation-dependent restriction protein DptG [Rhodopirellula sp. JC737]